MRIRSAAAMAIVSFLATIGSALGDTIITRDGSSYSGQYLGAKQGTLGFTDTSGIGYTFPVRDVLSLVFTSTNDTVTLRNGKVYSGKFNGPDTLAFKDNLGILYQFPRRNVESLVLSSAEAAQPNTPPQGSKVIPTGTDQHSHRREYRWHLALSQRRRGAIPFRKESHLAKFEHSALACSPER